MHRSRGRAWKCASTGASVPMCLECATLLACGGAHQLGSSQTRVLLWRFLWRLPYTSMIHKVVGHWGLVLSPAPLSSLRIGSGAQSSKLLSKPWSFWGPSALLRLSRGVAKSHPCQPLPCRKFQGFRSSVPGTREKAKSLL